MTQTDSHPTPPAAPARLPLLTIDQLFGDGDLEERIVPLPRLGGAVKIRSLLEVEREQITRQASIGPGPNNTAIIDNEKFAKLMIINSLVEPRLDRKELSAWLQKLGRKSARTVATLMKAVGELNALEEGAIEEAVEALKSGPDAAVED